MAHGVPLGAKPPSVTHCMAVGEAVDSTSGGVGGLVIGHRDTPVPSRLHVAAPVVHRVSAKQDVSKSVLGEPPLPSSETSKATKYASELSVAAGSQPLRLLRGSAMATMPRTPGDTGAHVTPGHASQGSLRDAAHVVHCEPAIVS